MSSPLQTPQPPKIQGLFIAGTDTGVGKTLVAAAILRHARNQGQRLLPFKPVETGASPFPSDARKLHEAAGAPISADLVCPYPLRLAAAPQVAACHEGTSISTDLIIEGARSLASLGDGVVVEGAGGLLVPYRPDLTGADLAALLGLPVLLVARTALGTINHTALSINELRRRDIPLAGLILVHTQPDRQPHEESNVPLIHQLTGVSALATLPYLDRTGPDDLALALVSSTPPEALAALLLMAAGKEPSSEAPSTRPADR